MRQPAMRHCLRFSLFFASGASVAPTIAVAQAMKVQALYVIPKGKQPRPNAERVIQSIMVDLQSHYLEQFGRTFELADPLVTRVEAPGDAAAAVDWSANVTLVKAATPTYASQQNVVYTIQEGTTGDGGGSWNIVTMPGNFWNEAYNTYMKTPHLLPTVLHGWSHELGHAFGLMHTLDAKPCLAKKGVDLGDLPSLVMQKEDDLGAVYNYGFLPQEKQMLMDATYQQDCLALLSEPGATPRPHPTKHLRRFSVQPYKGDVKGTNVTMVEFSGTGSQRGAFYRRPDGTWVESGYAGETRFTFKEASRDEWSVYLVDATRKANTQIDLHKMKIFVGDVGQRATMYYTVLWAK